jgi:hypothetical protein
MGTARKATAYHVVPDGTGDDDMTVRCRGKNCEDCADGWPRFKNLQAALFSI